MMKKIHILLVFSVVVVHGHMHFDPAMVNNNSWKRLIRHNKLRLVSIFT